MDTQPAPRRTPVSLCAVLYPGFELLDLFGPLEMFGCLAPDVTITTVAKRTGAVASSAGPKAWAEATFDTCPQADWLLVPGGIGTVAALDCTALMSHLARQATVATWVMSVCTGSALLARAGLLDGRRATSNKMYFDLARRQSTRVQWVNEARWVVDGNFATSSGVSAGIDMSLAVIERHFGRARAEGIAALTEYRWDPRPDHDPFVTELDRGNTDSLLAFAAAQQTGASTS